MQCPNCQFWNEVGYLFCEQCGSELVKGALDAVAAPAEMPLIPTPPDIQAMMLNTAPPPTSVQSVAANGGASTSVFSGPHLILVSTGTVFKLGNAVIIGRANPVAQIDFEGYPEGKYISYQHAQITFVNGAYYLEDMGSSNHTYVNGIKLSQGQAQPLKEGDRVRFAKLELIFHGA